jgi:hypothetical protein
VSFTPLGVFVALVFIGLPFVVRTVQPVLEDLNPRSRKPPPAWAPTAGRPSARGLPDRVPGAADRLCAGLRARVGEYGSVIFIAGNMPMVSEITPLLIITKLEQYDYAGATAIAVVMLVAAFVLLLLINGLQAWTAKRHREGADAAPTIDPTPAAQSAAWPAAPREAAAPPKSRPGCAGCSSAWRCLPRAVPVRAAGAVFFEALRRAGRSTSPPSPSPMRCRPSS